MAGFLCNGRSCGLRSTKKLCELVDRLHAVRRRCKLEAELRFTRLECDPNRNDFTKISPRLREEGVATVICTHCGQVLKLEAPHGHLKMT